MPCTLEIFHSFNSRINKLQTPEYNETSREKTIPFSILLLSLKLIKSLRQDLKSIIEAKIYFDGYLLEVIFRT